jgi:hypothetical protein
LRLALRCWLLRFARTHLRVFFRLAPAFHRSARMLVSTAMNCL